MPGSCLMVGRRRSRAGITPVFERKRQRKRHRWASAFATGAQLSDRPAGYNPAVTDPAAHPSGRRRHLALTGPARDVERDDDMYPRAEGMDQNVVSDDQRGEAAGLVLARLPGHRSRLEIGEITGQAAGASRMWLHDSPATARR